MSSKRLTVILVMDFANQPESIEQENSEFATQSEVVSSVGVLSLTGSSVESYQGH